MLLNVLITFVSWFCNNLTLSFFHTLQEGDLKYTLYGVLVHDGWNTHYGHYTCFVRTSNGFWYYLNDNQVWKITFYLLIHFRFWIKPLLLMI